MILTLSIILILLMLITGGEHGVRTVSSMFANIIIFILYMIAVARGFDFGILTITVIILFVFVTLFAQDGVNPKTVCSAIATIILEIIIFIPLRSFVLESSLAGYDEVNMSMDISNALNYNVNINMNDVITAVLMFGVLTVMLDASVDITGTVYELYLKKKDELFESEGIVEETEPDGEVRASCDVAEKTKEETKPDGEKNGFATGNRIKQVKNINMNQLYISGINMGKDIISTMANTMLFTALAESMTLSMYFIVHGYSIAKLLNSKAVFQKFTAIPLTVVATLLIIPLANLIMCMYLSFTHGRNKIDLKNKK